MWNAIENEDIELYAGYIHPDFTSCHRHNAWPG